MPYLPASTQAPVSAERAQITLSADKRIATVGEQVTFSGKVSGVSLPTSIYIQALINGSWVDQWGPISTDSQGNFSHSTVMPYGWGCRDMRFRAVHKPTGGTSNEVRVAVAFRTRITLEVPERVAVNTPFKVAGRLEYEESPGSWRPLAGKQVTVTLDGAPYETVTTGDDGSFSLDMVVDAPGDHTIGAEFAGHGLPATVTIAAVQVDVDQLADVLSKVLAVIPILTVGGVLVASEVSRR